MKKVLYLMIGLVLLVCFPGCNGDSGMYVVSFDSNGGSYVAPAYVYSGEKVKKPDPEPVKDGFLFIDWYKDYERSEKWDFDNDVVNNDMTLYAEWFGGCVVAGTMIAMADGSQKPVEEIQLTDEVKTYDFFEGGISSSKVIFMEKDNERASDVIEISTNHGESIKVVYKQSFFDMDTKKYFEINTYNCGQMIGRNIMVKSGNEIESAAITGVKLRKETVSYYELITEYDLNYFGNGVLTVCSECPSFFPFELDSDYKIDRDKMNSDIAQYGLFTYEEFPEDVSFETFDKFGLKYYKILLGKGLTTYEYMHYEWELAKKLIDKSSVITQYKF